VPEDILIQLRQTLLHLEEQKVGFRRREGGREGGREGIHSHASLFLFNRVIASLPL
jgi:hypothetical protein